MEAYDHRARAREALRGNWVTAVLVYLVAGLLIGSSDYPSFNFNLNIEAGHVDFSVSQELEHFLEGTLGLAMPLVLTLSLVLLVARLALGGVMSMGRATYSLNLIDGAEAEFADLFTGFRRFYDALIMNVVGILMVFLGALLFVVPGIILGYAYAMAPYILAENPEITGTEALRLSRQMMKGHKWELFWLELTFIGWSILAAFTLDLGNLALEPYKGISKASFYRDVQAQSRWDQVENF
ncbi:MAG: DUF975 family protein [Oscillospiraceae bacterium]|nr:DUF975 family protein [Oscillospiraceae bacterium]